VTSLPCCCRYQAAGEKLAVENFTLADELAKQKLTLQDINEFLTTELKARSLTAAQVPLLWLRQPVVFLLLQARRQAVQTCCLTPSV
jgi:hypothetical protein